MNTAIFGTGGFGRETLEWWLNAKQSAAIDASRVCFCVSDGHLKERTVNGVPVAMVSELSPSEWQLVIAIGDPRVRHSIVSSLPLAFAFGSIVHPTAVMGRFTALGPGAVVAPGAIVTTSVEIGAHAHLNLGCSVGHDCRIGAYFTAAPGAQISGGCTIGDRVNIGSNAAIRQGITICSDVTIGLSAAVVHDIIEPGTYAGVPARRLVK